MAFPFIYALTPRQPYAAGATLAYYGAATPSVLAATIGYLGWNFHGMCYGLLFWVLAVACGSLPWIVLYRQRWASLTAIAALTVLALPPLSLVTVAHPLLAAGCCFPGLAWVGLFLPLGALLGFRKHFAIPMALGLLIVGIGAHGVFHRPSTDSRIMAIDTKLGFPYSASGPSLFERTSRLLQTALAHSGKVLLFPEAAIPMWSRETDRYWEPLLGQLAEQRTSVILGTSLPIPATNANANVLITRGYGLHGAYVQRIPVPFLMWQPGARTAGYPLQLSAFPYMEVRGHRAAVLLCYEQLLMWPALQSFARKPEMLLAPSNQYWAKETKVPAIQHVAAQNWADLFAIPLYEAYNR